MPTRSAARRCFTSVPRTRTSRWSSHERVAEAAESRPGWEVPIQPDGGHAFDNWDNPMFHQPEPAARAWDLTRDFLARTLPAG